MEENLLTLVQSPFGVHKGFRKNIMFYQLSFSKLKNLIKQYYFSNYE